jgi:hypothetical protein
VPGVFVGQHELHTSEAAFRPGHLPNSHGSADIGHIGRRGWHDLSAMKQLETVLVEV